MVPKFNRTKLCAHKPSTIGHPLLARSAALCTGGDAVI